MESSSVIKALLSLIVSGLMIWGWRILNWAWLKPKKLENCLRKQGFKGNPYKHVSGDTKQSSVLTKQTTAKPMPLSDDIAPYVDPFFHQTILNHGKNSFIWMGTKPRVAITDPEEIRDVFTKFNDFHKTHNPLFRLLARGLSDLDDDEWAKHRKIINPAFHQDKLKNMLPAFYQSCIEMISKLEKMEFVEGSCELDVWPFLVNLTRDVISRAAFGSSYEEGTRIFHLLEEQTKLVVQANQLVYIPGWRFLPTKANRKMKANHNDIIKSLKEMIKKREKAIKEGGVMSNDDLLGILVESNIREIQAHGNHKGMGMSIEDVIEECKLFYFAGQETTSVLLVWTMILLARYPVWQTKAREEVLQAFGDRKPDSDGLNRLKIVTMILYEVLRLYPAVIMLERSVPKETTLGKCLLPAGSEITLPIVQIHHDKELWGEDANEFRPERFAEGVSKATKNQVIYFPFGWGPRICIGEKFALLEAKMALALILRQFWFELSPAYAHSPYCIVTLHPQHGAHIILHKI